MTNQPPQLQPGRYKNKRCSQDDKIISPLSLCAPVRQDWLVDTMYKHQSPEALHLASLGRADSKRPETTCRGITTAGKACRKPLKKGSRDKYCHLHLDQQTAYRSKPLRAKEMTVTIVTEVDEAEVEQEMRVAKTVVSNGLFTPMASPKQLSPAMKPVPSGSMVSPRPGLPPPSLQLCQRPIIPPPTPPHSVHRVTPMSDKLSYNKEKKQFFKLARAFGKLFIDDSPTSTPAIAGRPARDPPAWPVDVPLNDRYPSTHQPPGLPPSPPKIHTPPSPTPARPPIPPAHQHRIPVRHPTKPKVRVPQTQGRPPTVVLASAQSTSAITGVQRSWDTMWVPGIDGYGAHIICKEWLSPNLSAAGSQKILNCMRAPLSAGEEPGYIYVYKISEHSSKDEVYYKVGRAQNLTRRLYQWSRSCPYSPFLVEFFPSPPPKAATLEATTVDPITKCAVTHRVERLIHLELEDRFGRADIFSREGCKCGRVHKEWFRGGKGKGGGWTEVRDVIVRWIGFARVAYGELPA